VFTLIIVVACKLKCLGREGKWDKPSLVAKIVEDELGN
jgi:hypothetical protein